jgi:hypothetical protein
MASSRVVSASRLPVKGGVLRLVRDPVTVLTSNPSLPSRRSNRTSVPSGWAPSRLTCAIPSGDTVAESGSFTVATPR